MSAPMIDITEAKLLVVDDKIDNVILLEAMLDEAGYRTVISTTDSLEALPIQAREQCDLILLDLNMPGLDGFQILEKLRAEYADAAPPVIILTAVTDANMRIQGLELGARDFLIKPFDQAEVSCRIRNILEAHLLYRERRRQAEDLEVTVEQQTRQIRESQFEMIKRLGFAAEYRDNETGAHVVRMSTASAMLARAAGLAPEWCQLLGEASTMHDVGKIGIPDNILLKPGKLDPAEWEIMKSHVEIGAQILEGDTSEVVSLARSTALAHHEKWDGSGYPYGLSGTDIPLEGRIVAICDVFDALTSDRPYKEAWTPDAALTYINKEAGAHFDPNLVSSFNEIVDGVVDLRSNYPDEAEAHPLAMPA